MNKPLFIIILIIGVIAIGVVCFKIGFQLGAEQYKKVIDYYFPMSKEQVSVSGTITEIQDNVISVETTVQNSYVIPDEWESKIVKITVGDDTEITTFDYNTAKVTEINLSALKVGDEISAQASENIKGKNEFTAKEIHLHKLP